MRPLLTAVLAVALLACGSASPGAPPPPAGASDISDADAGRTLTFHLGERISVTLHQQPGFQPWSGLDSSDHAVLAPVVDTRNAAARGVTMGTFEARSAGEAQISANAGLDCSPGAACAMLLRVWSVTVEVV